MEKAVDILKNKQLKRTHKEKTSTVNSSPVYSIAVSPVNSIDTNKEKVKTRHPRGAEQKLRDKVSRVLEEFPQEIDYYARQLAMNLDDMLCLNYYRFLVRNNDLALLLECLAITKEAQKDGLIRKSSKLFFWGTLRNKGGITSKKDIEEMNKKVYN